MPIGYLYLKAVTSAGIAPSVGSSLPNKLSFLQQACLALVFTSSSECDHSCLYMMAYAINQIPFVGNAVSSLPRRREHLVPARGGSDGWRSQKVAPSLRAQSLAPKALIVKSNIYFSLIYVFLMASPCAFTLSNHITFQTQCNAIHFFLSLTKLTKEKRYGKCSTE